MHGVFASNVNTQLILIKEWSLKSICIKISFSKLFNEVIEFYPDSGDSKIH